MASYKIEYEHRIKKDLKKLDKKSIKRIVTAVDKLATNPYPSASKKLVGSDMQRLRVGDYRVIYTVHEDIVTVLILRIGHRKDVYKHN